jgi:dethiobiotin synthetase
MAAANTNIEYALVNPFAFAPAIAPHIAAAEAGTDIDINRIREHARQLAQRADVLVVEGVGGWQVPLAPDTSVADMAVALGYPVILVVGMRLGCLNHALLTAQSIQRAGLSLAGWVANDLSAEFPRRAENLASLEQRLSAPLLAHLPYHPGAPTEHLRQHINTTLFQSVIKDLN